MTTGPVYEEGPWGDRTAGFWAVAQRIAQAGTRGAARLEFLREASEQVLRLSGARVATWWMTDLELEYRWRMPADGSDAMPAEFQAFPGPRAAAGERASELGPRILALMTRLSGTHDDCFLAVEPVAFRALNDAGGADPLFAELCRQEEGCCVLLLLLREAPSLVGLLTLETGRAGGFRREDLPLYRQLAETISRAVLNRRAQERLRERIKELTCLHGIAEVSRRHGAAPEAALAAIVDLLPPAMQWPEIAAARVCVDHREYAVGSPGAALHRLSTPILIGGRERGSVEVAYVNPHPEFVAGPFLREERDLLASVALEIALLVERAEAAAARAELAEQLRHRDRLATIGQLAAGVAHELNEPLGNIMGFAELIQKHADLPEGAAKDARQIVLAALHGREIVRNLLLFARQSRTERVRLDLGQLVSESMYFLEGRCRAGRIKLRLDLTGEPTPIVADASQVTQVLVNLGMNAIQAMPDGGTLTILTRTTGETIRLTVQDTGVGMDERTQERLFTPFFTTKDVGAGTGLGLSVVLGIVSAHGGTIHVKSAPGHGSCFEVNWPAAPPRAIVEETA